MDVFDIKNCVRFEDTTYFWDTRTKTVIALDMQSVDIERCPKQIVKALLIAAHRREG
jgi:hypothetical protein